MKLDLTEIRNVLAHVQQLLAVHDGAQLPQAQIGAAVRTSGRVAELQGDLAAAQEYLRLADAQLATMGLITAGRTDPRRPPARPWQGAPGTVVDTNRRAGTAPGRVIRVPDQPTVRL